MEISKCFGSWAGSKFYCSRENFICRVSLKIYIKHKLLTICLMPLGFNIFGSQTTQCTTPDYFRIWICIRRKQFGSDKIIWHPWIRIGHSGDDQRSMTPGGWIWGPASVSYLFVSPGGWIWGPASVSYLFLSPGGWIWGPASVSYLFLSPGGWIWGPASVFYIWLPPVCSSPSSPPASHPPGNATAALTNCISEQRRSQILRSGQIHDVKYP